MSAAPRRVGAVEVSAVGLGGARWSLAPEPDEDAAERTVHAALDAGVTLFDTALAYTTTTHPAHNEALMARALRAHHRGGEVLLATKGGHVRDPAGGFPIDARPQTLHRHCRLSLATLGVEQLDLYYLHWPDPQVPITDSVGALAELRDQGLIRMLGVCNVTLEQLAQAASVTGIDAVQNSFSPLRTTDRPMVDHCAAAGIAYLSYSPLGGPAGARGLAEYLPAFAEVAEQHGCTAQQVALAWLLAQSPTLVPIIGAGRPASIVAAAHASELQLAATELARLDRSVQDARLPDAS